MTSELHIRSTDTADVLLVSCLPPPPTTTTTPAPASEPLPPSPSSSPLPPPLPLPPSASTATTTAGALSIVDTKEEEVTSELGQCSDLSDGSITDPF
ncbi:hypothetical protein R3P38DRAFT_3229758 [Favolaschia claudopus]|uniref:Uncharacterized protein n=1 Tax=Favolaschia claudopus TaxID=2862362 RepID=A0AAV9ZNM3_9AGAR